MKIYLYFNGYFPFSLTFGANALENPIFFASALGEFLGLALALCSVSFFMLSAIVITPITFW
jgi:hypothetical protein